jgi:hypothetical protein
VPFIVAAIIIVFYLFPGKKPRGWSEIRVGMTQTEAQMASGIKLWDGEEAGSSSDGNSPWHFQYADDLHWNGHWELQVSYQYSASGREEINSVKKSWNYQFTRRP